MNKPRLPRQLLLWLSLILFLGGFLFLFKMDWRALSFFQEDATIVLDAGHGGIDPGAQGHDQLEKALTLDVALRLKKELERRGWRARMTRETDDTLSLSERVRVANEIKDAIFISIHFNKSDNPGATGIETFYRNKSGDLENSPDAALAGFAQTALIARMGAVDRGIKEANFYVLRNTRHPAILVECGFLSNRMEALLASGAGYRQNLALAITEGIGIFFEQTRREKDQTPP